MDSIKIGEFRDGRSEVACLELDRLLETRMLVQANSGYGKSWLLRRVLEQTAGLVQQIVVDPEGEFATLREKHDYVIAAAHDGDALAHPKTAQLLARKLLETGVSAILDIYDLKRHERQSFVRIFLQALVDAPKTLWHPVLVVLDEAHLFCPEKEQAEASGAVIDVATRGRKRGLCLVCATQRIAKFNKDAAAELLNKLIGRTGLDVDVKRAAFELGMTPADAMEKLRALAPGDFYGFGPAISPRVRALAVGKVHTTHPKAGERGNLRAPPKPTAAILAVLPKLADLPKEAEAEATTLEEMKRQLRATVRELEFAKQGKPYSLENLEAVKREAAQIKSDTITKLEQRAHAIGFREGFEEAARQHNDILMEIGRTTLGTLIEAKRRRLTQPTPPAPMKTTSAVLLPPASVTVREKPVPRETSAAHRANGAGELGRMARKILEVLSQQEEGADLKRLTLLTGYRLSGGFRNALTELRNLGFIEGDNLSTMRITAEGRAQGPFAPLPGRDRLLAYWLAHPSFATMPRKILSALAEHPDGLTIEEIAQATDYEVSGGFRNALTDLRNAGVMLGRNTETMKISPEILP